MFKCFFWGSMLSGFIWRQLQDGGYWLGIRVAALYRVAKRRDLSAISRETRPSLGTHVIPAQDS